MHNLFFASLVLVSTWLVPVAQAFTFGDRPCTLLSCEGISRAKIREFRDGNLVEHFYNDPENVKTFTAEFKGSRYALPSYLTFDQWYEDRFDEETVKFRSRLDELLQEIKNLENTFQVRLHNDDQQGTFFETLQGLQKILVAPDKDKKVCKVAVIEGRPEMNCYSERRVCVPIQVSNWLYSYERLDCSPAHSHCGYNKVWNLLLRSQTGENSVVFRGVISNESIVEKKGRHLDLQPLKAEASKLFGLKEEQLTAVLNSIPQC